MSGSCLKSVLWLPGMPHMLKPEINAGYQSLHAAADALGAQLREAGIQRIVYFSTSWLSVLGQSVQMGQNLRGRHTDENWHELGDLEFSFNVDRAFGAALIERLRAQAMPVQAVDYVGFPVDTATIVADRLLNPERLPVSVLACHVYSDAAATRRLAGLLRAQIDASQQATAVVCVTGLSGRFFTTEIDLREDRISSAEDDRWNKQMLGWLSEGAWSEVDKNLSAYVAATKVDMGFKAYAFTRGLYGAALPPAAKCLAYGSLYGSGAAVLQFDSEGVS